MTLLSPEAHDPLEGWTTGGRTELRRSDDEQVCRLHDLHWRLPTRGPHRARCTAVPARRMAGGAGGPGRGATGHCRRVHDYRNHGDVGVVHRHQHSAQGGGRLRHHLGSARPGSRGRDRGAAVPGPNRQLGDVPVRVRRRLELPLPRSPLVGCGRPGLPVRGRARDHLGRARLTRAGNHAVRGHGSDLKRATWLDHSPPIAPQSGRRAASGQPCRRLRALLSGRHRHHGGRGDERQSRTPTTGHSTGHHGCLGHHAGRLRDCGGVVRHGRSARAASLQPPRDGGLRPRRRVRPVWAALQHSDGRLVHPGRGAASIAGHG